MAPKIAKEEHRILMFLCYREMMTDSERAKFLNEHISIEVGSEDKPRPWRDFKVTEWRNIRGRTAKFFTLDQRSADSMIYNKSMKVFTKSDQITISEYLKKHHSSLPTIVQDMWTDEHFKNELSNLYTRDDIENAVYAMVRSEVSERRDKHDPWTWPREWMVELAEIWRGLGGKPRGEGEANNPGPRTMRPAVLLMLRTKPELESFKDEQYTTRDTFKAKVQAIRWGFIWGEGAEAYMAVSPEGETLDISAPGLLAR